MSTIFQVTSDFATKKWFGFFRSLFVDWALVDKWYPATLVFYFRRRLSYTRTGGNPLSIVHKNGGHPLSMCDGGRTWRKHDATFRSLCIVFSI